MFYKVRAFQFGPDPRARIKIMQGVNLYTCTTCMRTLAQKQTVAVQSTSCRVQAAEHKVQSTRLLRDLPDDITE